MSVVLLTAVAASCFFGDRDDRKRPPGFASPFRARSPRLAACGLLRVRWGLATSGDPMRAATRALLEVAAGRAGPVGRFAAEALALEDTGSAARMRRLRANRHKVTRPPDREASQSDAANDPNGRHIVTAVGEGVGGGGLSGSLQVIEITASSKRSKITTASSAMGLARTLPDTAHEDEHRRRAQHQIEQLISLDLEKKTGEGTR